MLPQHRALNRRRPPQSHTCPSVSNLLSPTLSLYSPPISNGQLIGERGLVYPYHSTVETKITETKTRLADTFPKNALSRDGSVFDELTPMFIHRQVEPGSIVGLPVCREEEL